MKAKKSYGLVTSARKSEKTTFFHNQKTCLRPSKYKNLKEQKINCRHRVKFHKHIKGQENALFLGQLHDSSILDCKLAPTPCTLSKLDGGKKRVLGERMLMFYHITPL